MIAGKLTQLEGTGFVAENPLGRGEVHECLWVFVAFGRFPYVPGRLSHPPGPRERPKGPEFGQQPQVFNLSPSPPNPYVFDLLPPPSPIGPSRGPYFCINALYRMPRIPGAPEKARDPGPPRPIQAHCCRAWPGGNIDLVSIKPRCTNYNFSLVFRTFPGQTWPRDPCQRVRLDKLCRTHLKLAPETNSKAMSWPLPGLGKKLKLKMME
jgi:hypothetical protein